MSRPRAAGEADGQSSAAEAAQLESTYAWLRLAAAVGLSTIGGAGMWSVVVALPALQAEFGVARAAASFPYTLTMVCFGLGGVLMGRLADRFGVVFPIVLGIITLGAGYVIAAAATTLWQFSLAQGVLLGLGSSATFAPLLSDTSKWFTRRRGMAVGICASGNYLAGTLWPPVVQHFINVAGWRHTYVGIGLFCFVTMLALSVVLRRSAPKQSDTSADASGAPWSSRPLGLSPFALQVLLSIAGVACCVAMSMPQVHLVAYCADLGYGAARGAEMLSVMLGFGIVSRLDFGMDLRSHRRAAHAVARLHAARHRPVAVRSVRRFVIPLCHRRAVRVVSGRYRPILRDHHSRLFSAAGNRIASWHRDHGYSLRDGARRLDVGSDLRSHRLVQGRIRQWSGVECDQRVDSGVAVAACAYRITAGACDVKRLCIRCAASSLRLL